MEVPALRTLLAAVRQSCAGACAERGLVCTADGLAEGALMVATEAAMGSAVAALGRVCGAYGRGDPPPDAPSPQSHAPFAAAMA
eukprot:gene11261-43396_t